MNKFKSSDLTLLSYWFSVATKLMSVIMIIIISYYSLTEEFIKLKIFGLIGFLLTVIFLFLHRHFANLINKKKKEEEIFIDRPHESKFMKAFKNAQRNQINKNKKD